MRSKIISQNGQLVGPAMDTALFLDGKCLEISRPMGVCTTSKRFNLSFSLYHCSTVAVLPTLNVSHQRLKNILECKTCADYKI